MAVSVYSTPTVYTQQVDCDIGHL